MSSVDVVLTPLRKRKLTVLMDIPSPYRLHFFRSLSAKLCEQHIDLHVLFMGKSVPIRSWNFNERDWLFKYNFYSGIHLHIRQHSFHFNPGIIWTILRHPPDWLILGGAWNMPTTMLCIKALAALHRKTVMVLWAEANFRSSTAKSPLLQWLRNWVIKDVDAYAVPGHVARTTLLGHWEAPNKPFLDLPNIVDENIFSTKVRNLRAKREELRGHLGMYDGHLVLIWPARLHEPTKGIISFIGIIKELILPHVRILIAGEGPDRLRITQYVEIEGLGTNIILLGQKTQEEMAELYAIADVFLLPSLKDPNPLSVIEALWAGLPVFISLGCGNHPEAVEVGENGWVISHDYPDTLRGAFADMLGQTMKERDAFGARSEKLANERFSTDGCVENFVNEIVCIK